MKLQTEKTLIVQLRSTKPPQHELTLIFRLIYWKEYCSAMSKHFILFIYFSDHALKKSTRIKYSLVFQIENDKVINWFSN
jgi:hypothetical protein